jgi:hypothetical protein
VLFAPGKARDYVLCSFWRYCSLGFSSTGYRDSKFLVDILIK